MSSVSDMVVISVVVIAVVVVSRVIIVIVVTGNGQSLVSLRVRSARINIS